VSIYLYGVVGANEAASASLGTGVGDPPRAVSPLAHGVVAALVSQIPEQEISTPNVRSLRRNMKAHADVLNRLVADSVTVLPFRFGVAMPDAQSVVNRLLSPRQSALGAYLQRLEGAVEITFKASYLEDRVLKEVVAEQPQLVASRSGPRSGRQSYQSRIDLGRRVAAAIQNKRQIDAKRLLSDLGRVAREVNVSQPGADTVVLNASFLVPRAELNQFDRILEQLAAKLRGRMQLDCVGPLPPYSFVDLRL